MPGNISIVGAEPNPKIHRPSFKQVSKHIWKAPRQTARRYLKLNPANKYYEFPKLTLGTGVMGFVGFLATGGTGNLMNMLADKMGETLKFATHPAFEGFKDIVRIGGEAGLGMGVYPSFGHNITGKENMGKAVFAGAAILAALDVGATGAKYIGRAYFKKKAAEPAPEQQAAMTMTGLGSLAEFIKGTAETAADAETAHTAEVADLSEAEAERMLAGEMKRFQELSELAAQVGGQENSGSLMR